ncbi:hypothetical protein G4177_10180 [Corallococcus sp. ZKHCc1 1396]|uniref:SGNH hydrolase-type esterase domain-containing protein n=1 Tax=Corallococcus soli TaxID=2710757 RepID=A0ABR9PKR5_9BACT|nr:SGNH/GDSL hydrolase family protein [Corallococcus soli]MBE4748531.1 hypothetical protein [Corallococcus soli]
MAAAQPLWSFGDSITYGYPFGLSSGYPVAVGRALGRRALNFAFPGNEAPDQADAIYSVAPTAGSLSTYMIGVNDADRGDLPADQALFTSCLLAQTAWLAIDNAEIVRGLDARFAFDSNWGPSQRFFLGMSTLVEGATFQVELTGDTVYVAFIQLYGPEASKGQALGLCAVDVDGVPMAAFPTATAVAQGSAAIGPSSYQAPGLLRISGLKPGSHILTGRITGGLVFVDWAWGNGQARQASGMRPCLLLGTPTRLSPNAYQQHGSLAATLDYGRMIGQVAATLQADGLDVWVVDTCSVIDPLADLIDDGVHPSLVGQAKLAQAFIAAAGPGTGEIARSGS